MSCQDAIADFIAFMEANGVKPVEEIASRLASGALIRFQCEGDAKGRKNGWAILYLDERPAGAFGNYKRNTGTLKWKAHSDRPALSAAERAALQREWQEARDKREQIKQDAEGQAALDAAAMWQRSGPASIDHPYIVAKGIDAGALRQNGRLLIVPMCDQDGTLWNLQSIAPDGTKRFLRGGRINDCFALVGSFENATEAVIVEGYATGDTVHRATGLPVIVTFNTANMPRVARLWAELRADLTYTVFADDDERTAQEFVARGQPYKNPGIETAEAVAAEIGGYVAYPLGKPQRGAA